MHAYTYCCDIGTSVKPLCHELVDSHVGRDKSDAQGCNSLKKFVGDDKISIQGIGAGHVDVGAVWAKPTILQRGSEVSPRCLILYLQLLPAGDDNWMVDTAAVATLTEEVAVFGVSLSVCALTNGEGKNDI